MDDSTKGGLADKGKEVRRQGITGNQGLIAREDLAPLNSREIFGLNINDNYGGNLLPVESSVHTFKNPILDVNQSLGLQTIEKSGLTDNMELGLEKSSPMPQISFGPQDEKVSTQEGIGLIDTGHIIQIGSEIVGKYRSTVQGASSSLKRRARNRRHDTTQIENDSWLGKMDSQTMGEVKDLSVKKQKNGSISGNGRAENEGSVGRFQSACREQ